MHPQRKKRLTLILFLVIGFGVAVGLLMYSLSQNINLFQTPTQIASGDVPVGRTIRAGGLVVKGSLQRDDQGLAVTFNVTDGAATVPIHYEGCAGAGSRRRQAGAAGRGVETSVLFDL